MARYSKDRSTRSISIGPALPVTYAGENAGRTPANPGNTTGPGDEFAYVPGYGHAFQFPVNISWDFNFTGGTFTTLAIVIEVSNDGVNWSSIGSADSTGVGKAISVAVAGFRLFRANITTYSVASGTPIVTVGLSF